MPQPLGTDYTVGLLRRIAAGHRPNLKQLEELTYDGLLDENGALTPKATALINQKEGH